MDSEEPDRLATFAEAHTAAICDAIATVEQSMSGRPVPDVEAHLIHELRLRDIFLGPDEIHAESRRISDPDWARKDPATLQRLLTEVTDPAKVQEEAAFEEQWDRVSERLESTLDSMWGLRRSSVSSHRTVDGVAFVVRIDPWSPRRARKLQRVAAPMRLTVRPY